MDHKRDERWQLAESTPMFKSPPPSNGAAPMPAPENIVPHLGDDPLEMVRNLLAQPARERSFEAYDDAPPPKDTARLGQVVDNAAAQPAPLFAPTAPFSTPERATDITPQDVTAAATSAEAEGDDSDRRSGNQPNERMIGRMSSCSGARAVISTSATHLNGAKTDFWSVGRLISIEAPATRVVAMVCSMHTTTGGWTEGQTNHIDVEVELIGEVRDSQRGPMFKRGVSAYPPLGAVAHRIRARDLEAMHDLGSRRGIDVGTLSQNANIPARISVEDLLKRHFAVLGSTGVGKSCALTLIVRRMVEVTPTLRVVMLDPHNEFIGAMGDIAVGIEVEQINLPYWIFKFEELEDVVFKGRPNADESEILRELVIDAKRVRMGNAGAPAGLNADTPVPYRMSDMLHLIDEAIGLFEPRWDKRLLRSLKVRMESLASDPRYSFMFANGGLTDNLDQVLTEIFRLPAHGKPVSILNLATLPSEVVNAVVSVLARLAFDIAYAAKGSLNVLLVCEEAHRYVPADVNAGFIPTRRAIARIAKEGRKYGCAIAVVTQRPGELDPTILSQCSTVFAMRLANDNDQEIIRSAIPDSSSSTVSFLSALDNREAIAFGEGVAAPMRLYFAEEPSHKLPGVRGDDVRLANADQLNISALVAGMRRAVVAQRQHRADAPVAAPKMASAGPAPEIGASKTLLNPQDAIARAARAADELRKVSAPSPTPNVGGGFGHKAVKPEAPSIAAPSAVRSALLKKPLTDI